MTRLVRVDDLGPCNIVEANEEILVDAPNDKERANEIIGDGVGVGVRLNAVALFHLKIERHGTTFGTIGG